MWEKINSSFFHLYCANRVIEGKISTIKVKLATKIRKNMRNSLLNIFDKLLLRKRDIIEPFGSILKNTCNIEYSIY
ncbi:hypothetical protein H0X06_05535 [Candidatus Dependentiae bacterium]|nr:hypothetical protein [Candidatus Dependentiae bacterium]